MEEDALNYTSQWFIWNSAEECWVEIPKAVVKRADLGHTLAEYDSRIQEFLAGLPDGADPQESDEFMDWCYSAAQIECALKYPEYREWMTLRVIDDA